MRRRTVLRAAGVCGLTGLMASASQTPWCLSAATAAESSGPWLRKTLKLGMIQVPGTLEEKFRAAEEAGFEGVEVNVPGIDVDQVNAAAEAAGVVIDGSVGGTHWQTRHSDPDPKVRAQALANLKRGIEETAAVGGDSCLLVVGHGKDGTPAEVNARSVKNIRAALPTAEKHEVAILVENVWNHFLYDHDGGADQSAQPLADYVDQFHSPWVGLQFDLGNHWKYGDVAEWIRTLGSRIKKLDIKGFSRERDRFTKITEGDVDWASIEAALAEIGFRGWCAAEVGGGDLARLKEIAAHMDEALHCSASQPMT